MSLKYLPPPWANLCLIPISWQLLTGQVTSKTLQNICRMSRQVAFTPRLKILYTSFVTHKYNTISELCIIYKKIHNFFDGDVLCLTHTVYVGPSVT